MQILSTISETRAVLRQLRLAAEFPARTIGLVPTMGALHEGHRSLVHAACQRCDLVAVSIFVNPAQFGPAEDFARYPRTLDADCRMLETEGVDLVFTPAVEEMYSTGASTFVDVGGVSDRLDGASRPGHFRGVATVVTKLFNIIEPDLAFFGQKDAAQVAVLRQMVRDLNFPVELVTCPTIREGDGLAISSRNRYLSQQERQQAPMLYRALRVAEHLAIQGESRAKPLFKAMRDAIAEDSGVRVDYLAIVNPETLLPLKDTADGALLAIAAFVGGTRLIDNILLPPSV